MIRDNLDGLINSGRFGEETLEEELLVRVLEDKSLLQALDKLEQEFPLVVQPPQGFQARGLEQPRGKLETLTPHR